MACPTVRFVHIRNRVTIGHSMPEVRCSIEAPAFLRCQETHVVGRVPVDLIGPRDSIVRVRVPLPLLLDGMRGDALRSIAVRKKTLKRSIGVAAYPEQCVVEAGSRALGLNALLHDGG